MNAPEDLPLRVAAFVAPSADALALRLAGTREFLAEAEQRPLSIADRIRKTRATKSTILPGDCTMTGVSGENREALLEVGFRPITRQSDRAGLISISVERWVGPDGAIVVEVSPSGMLFFIGAMEDNRKLGVNKGGPLFRLMQFPHRYVAATGHPAKDYLKLAEMMVEYMEAHDTRPIYRSTDVELDARGRQYYEIRAKSLVMATVPMLIIVANVALLVWLSAAR